MMIAADDVVIDIDERILREEEWSVPAIEAASDFFRRELEAHPGLVPTGGRLRWSVGEYVSGGKRILRTYSEPNDDGQTRRALRTEFFAEQLLDPVRRDVSMLQLLQDILEWRVASVNVRIRDHLRELDNGHPD